MLAYFHKVSDQEIYLEFGIQFYIFENVNLALAFTSFNKGNR